MISNDNNHNNDQAGNEPSNAMNTKRDVAQSPDEKTDQDFPGYPHYPAKEDIMAQSTGSHRVDANVEEQRSGDNVSGVSQRFPAGQENSRSEIEPLHRDAAAADGAMDHHNSNEPGVPQNLSNEDLPPEQNTNDIAEAAEKGSLNP